VAASSKSHRALPAAGNTQVSAVTGFLFRSLKPGRVPKLTGGFVEGRQEKLEKGES
jgi:hypothetical protein